MKRAIVGMVLMLGVSMISVQSATSRDSMRIDGVAAYVNAHTITIGDVLKASRRLQAMLANQATKPADADAVYQSVLQELIERKLIVDDYERQKKIKIPEDAFEERANAVINELFDGSRDKLLEALAADNITEEQWRESLRERIIVNAMKNLNVDSKITISPLDV